MLLKLLLYNLCRAKKFHGGDSDWPYLTSDKNTESTHSLVSLILGHNVSEDLVCKSIPNNVEKNANFSINTENDRNKEDVRCNDVGSWINNGVRGKINLHIQNPANPKNYVYACMICSVEM